VADKETKSWVDTLRDFFGGEDPARPVYTRPPARPEYVLSATGNIENARAQRQSTGQTGPIRENPVFEPPVSARTHEHPGLRAQTRRLAAYADPESTEGIPLARLGYSLAAPDQIKRWRTSTNLLGRYFPSAGSIEDFNNSTGPVEQRIAREAGLDPATDVGNIGLGPEAQYGDYGRSGGTFEHELMHKAIERLLPLLSEEDRKFIEANGEETVVRRLIDTNLGHDTFGEFFNSVSPATLRRIDGITARLNTLANEELKPKSKASGGVVIDDGNPAKRRKLI